MKILGYRDLLTRDEWLRLRKQAIFSTDTAAILGLSKYRSAADVIVDKLSDEISDSDSEIMRDGRELETFCQKRFEDNTGIVTKPMLAVAVHPQNEFLGANFDFEVIDQDALLETKTVSQHTWPMWADALPQHYLIQVLQQLYVSGRSLAYVQGWCYGKGTRVYKVEADRKLFDDIVGKVKEFWDTYIVAREPYTHGSLDPDYLRTLYPKATEERIILPAEFKDILDEYNEIKKNVAVANARIDEIKASVMAELKTNSAGVIGMHEVRWKNVSSERVDLKDMKSKHPDIVQAFTKTCETRRLTITRGGVEE